MIETLSSGARVASKKHYDSSYDYIRDWFNNCRPFREEGLAFTEYRALASLVANSGYIQPGQVYNWANVKHDGYLHVWKSLPDIEKICWKHEVYPTGDW